MARMRESSIRAASLHQGERDKIRKAILEYCGQDTLVLVRILEVLRGIRR